MSEKNETRPLPPLPPGSKFFSVEHDMHKFEMVSDTGRIKNGVWLNMNFSKDWHTVIALVAVHEWKKIDDSKSQILDWEEWGGL